MRIYDGRDDRNEPTDYHNRESGLAGKALSYQYWDPTGTEWFGLKDPDRLETFLETDSPLEVLP